MQWFALDLGVELDLELDHELQLKPLERPRRCIVFQLELVVHLVGVHLFQGKAEQACHPTRNTSGEEEAQPSAQSPAQPPMRV